MRHLCDKVKKFELSLESKNLVKVRKVAKIRNRYNQVPHLIHIKHAETGYSVV